MVWRPFHYAQLWCTVTEAKSDFCPRMLRIFSNLRSCTPLSFAISLTTHDWRRGSFNISTHESHYSAGDTLEALHISKPETSFENIWILRDRHSAIQNLGKGAFTSTQDLPPVDYFTYRSTWKWDSSHFFLLQRGLSLVC